MPVFSNVHLEEYFVRQCIKALVSEWQSLQFPSINAQIKGLADGELQEGIDFSSVWFSTMFTQFAVCV